MKSLMLLFTLLLISINSISQCPETSTVLLRTQSELNEFLNKYPNCSEIKNDLRIGYIDSDNKKSDITDLSGLHKITKIGKSLVIGSLQDIQYLNGLDNIERIESSLSITQNIQLKDLNIFKKLTYIGGGINLNQNDSLMNMSGLTNVQKLGGSLIIQFNRNLRIIDGLKKISKISGKLTIRQSPLLENLSGLNGIQQVYGPVVIENTGIENVDALSKLDTIKGKFSSLSISRNFKLTNLNGLSSLKFILDAMYIDICPKLESIDSMKQISYLGKGLRIRDTKVNSLLALSSFKVKGGFVWIEKNNNLETLDGLNVSDTIYGQLKIVNNFNLKDISVFKNVDKINGAVQIVGNGKLADCSGLCKVISKGQATSLNIFSNKDGCNSVDEIKTDSCLTISSKQLDPREYLDFKTFPNPSIDVISIVLNKQFTKPIKCLISTITGKIIYNKIFTPSNNLIEINLQNHKSGLYYISIIQNKQVVTKKFSIL